MGSNSISDSVPGAVWHMAACSAPARVNSAARLTFLATGRTATSVAFTQNVSHVTSAAYRSVMYLCKTLRPVYMEECFQISVFCLASSTYQHGISKHVFSPLFFPGSEHAFTTLTVFNKGGTLHPGSPQGFRKDYFSLICFPQTKII